MAGDANRERQCEIGLAGDAEVFANEPRGMGAEFDIPAGLEIGWGLDFDRQQDIAGVNVIEEVARLFIDHGCGPLNGAGMEAGREGPIDAGGDAGVTRVLPVGVPSGLRLKAETDGYRGARDDAVGIGEELRVHEFAAFVHLGVAEAGEGHEEGEAFEHGDSIS